MITEKENTRISKFLSLVLRHQPEAIGIKLDKNGWTDVSDLIHRINVNGFSVTKEILDHVVEKNSKKRFAYNEDRTKIRASQGHSVDINLGYEAKEPPVVLYHGTASRFVDSILKNGLQKGSRHHVHLSEAIGTATQVGQRHGKPVIFEVSAVQMFEDGFAFFVSENNVWLTDYIPVKYLKLL